MCTASLFCPQFGFWPVEVVRSHVGDRCRCCKWLSFILPLKVSQIAWKTAVTQDVLLILLSLESAVIVNIPAVQYMLVRLSIHHIAFFFTRHSEYCCSHPSTFHFFQKAVMWMLDCLGLIISLCSAYFGRDDLFKLLKVL